MVRRLLGRRPGAPFEHPGAHLRAQYQWVRYRKGEDCTIGGPLDAPGPPPPPSGDVSELHVQDIVLELAARVTQVIARASISDGLGQPAGGAAVTGTWNGVITSGDTLRSTDDSRIAPFYSARGRMPVRAGPRAIDRWRRRGPEVHLRLVPPAPGCSDDVVQDPVERP